MVAAHTLARAPSISSSMSKVGPSEDVGELIGRLCVAEGVGASVATSLVGICVGMRNGASVELGEDMRVGTRVGRGVGVCVGKGM